MIPVKYDTLRFLSGGTFKRDEKLPTKFDTISLNKAFYQKCKSNTSVAKKKDW